MLVFANLIFSPYHVNSQLCDYNAIFSECSIHQEYNYTITENMLYVT